jgi:hypothetical protein
MAKIQVLGWLRFCHFDVAAVWRVSGFAHPWQIDLTGMCGRRDDGKTATG